MYFCNYFFQDLDSWNLMQSKNAQIKVDPGLLHRYILRRVSKKFILYFSEFYFIFYVFYKFIQFSRILNRKGIQKLNKLMNADSGLRLRKGDTTHGRNQPTGPMPWRTAGCARGRSPHPGRPQWRGRWELAGNCGAMRSAP
jgi:hypothetical protein